VVAGKAERHPPVEATYLDVHASSALKDSGVAVGAVIDDARLSARGTDDLDSLSRYDGLRAIRVNALGAYALGLTKHMPPEAAASAQSIKVLPNHDVVALGELPLGDQMTLSAFADQSSDRVWQLTAGSLLAAIANGRRIEELFDVLDRASSQELPSTVDALISDVTRRSEAQR